MRCLAEEGQWQLPMRHLFNNVIFRGGKLAVSGRDNLWSPCPKSIGPVESFNLVLSRDIYSFKRQCRGKPSKPGAPSATHEPVGARGRQRTKKLLRHSQIRTSRHPCHRMQLAPDPSWHLILAQAPSPRSRTRCTWRECSPPFLTFLKQDLTSSVNEKACTRLGWKGHI